MKTCDGLLNRGAWLALLMLGVGLTLAEAQVTLSAPGLSAVPGSQVKIPVNIGNVSSTNNVGSYEFEMTCDSTIIRFTGVDAAGTLCEGNGPTVNYTVPPRGPGRIKVVWSSTSTIVTSGILIYIKATAQSKIGSTPLALINCYAWKLASPPPSLTVTSTNGSLSTGPPVNQKPVFVTKMADATINDQTPYSFAYSATDPDAGTTLTYKLESGPTGATVSNAGLFSWTPTASQLGLFNIVVSVSDGALADTAKAKLTVVHVNRAPTFAAELASQTVNQGSTINFTYTATDPDAGTSLLFSLVSPPTGATITSAGVFTFVLPANPAGSYLITAVVRDGSLADTAKATITVNRKPVLGSSTPATLTKVSRNVATTFTANATDPDGNTLTFTWKVNGVAEAVTGNTLTKTFTDAHNTPKTVTAIFADPGGLKDSTTWSFTITPVEGMEVMPTDYALGQNYPNPFNPTTTISYALPKEASVTFEIYNMLGVRIRTLMFGQTKSAGFYTINWDGKDDAGSVMSSGIYLYRVSAGSFVASKKMTLLK